MSTPLPEDKNVVLQTMETWFRAQYEDPAQRTPYESAEGGYIWVWGGPYDPSEVLHNAFSGEVPDEWISELASELAGENPEWAPIPHMEDYDETLFDAVTSNSEALDTCSDALRTLTDLIEASDSLEDPQPLLRLLYANAVTVLETFLSDFFINAVLKDRARFRRFVESNPDFKKQTISVSAVLEAVETLEEDVKRYLLDVVWHNLAKVAAMYRDTLDIDFGAAFREVARAIPVRHDIVHRNGRTKEGELHDITREEVLALVQSVRILTVEIEVQLDLGASEVPEPDDFPES